MSARLLLVILVSCWCAAIITTPLLASREGVAKEAASVSYYVFSRVCHQLDSHSFHLLGNKLAVCARCTSIYGSFFLGLLFFPLLKRIYHGPSKPARLLALSMLPMGIDVALDGLAIHLSTVATRVLTGSLFGFALAILLVPVLEEVIHDLIVPLITGAQTEKSVI